MTFGDGPGNTNKSLVMQTCRADGTLLKPDMPAMAIERTWDTKAFKDDAGPAGEVWTTHVSIDDCHAAKPHTWHFVFANKLGADFDFLLSDLHQPADGDLVAWEYDTAKATKVQASTPITLKAGTDYGSVRFWRLSPAMSAGFAIIGEPNKFVGVARQRFGCFSQDSEKIEASVIGAPNEVVDIVVADASQGLHTVQCKLSSEGKAQLTAPVAGGGAFQCA